MTPSLDQNAERFKALGHPVRLAILRLVVQGHQEGTPDAVGIPASTLSHHLACLAETSLVQVEREGTTLRYRAHFETLHGLTEYLWQDCCKGGRACLAATPAESPGCGSSQGCCTS